VATKAASSNTRLLAIGALVLVVGVILVLLVLRGTVGAPSAAPADLPTDVDPAAQVGEEGLAPDAPPTATTVEELASVRLPLPPSVPDGYEAVAVRASFVRGLAAIPTPGDHVNLYRAVADDEATSDDDAAPVDAELVLGDLEVLALIGPLPTQNEGEVTFLLAVDPDDVPGLLPVAGSAELWFTLLPATDAEEAA
jgi:hypothetical protein